MIIAQPQQKILFKSGTILSMDAAVGDLQEGDVLIVDGKIAAIARSIEAGDAEIIDARDAIVMPGLIDAHRHAWQGSLKRLMPNVSDLNSYIDATHFSLAKHYRPEDMYLGNLLTALSCLDAGTTTIIDAAHNARSPEHTDACIDALEIAGIRALHMPGKPLAGTWNEHWPLDLVRLKAERFSSEDQLVSLGMFCSPDPELFQFAAHNKLRTLTEFLGPMAPMLEQVKDIIGPLNIFNHCTTLPPESWKIFADAGVSITVDPRSDAQYGLAGGIFAYQEAVDNGLRPGIGTDLETAYGGDMFTEMRIAFSLLRATSQSRRYRGDEKSPAPIQSRALLEASTIDGARCAGLEQKIGSLAPGKQADVIMIRTDNLSLFPANNAVGTVVHAAERGNVDTVVVNGVVRKRKGAMLDVDFTSLRRRTEASLEHLYTAVGYMPSLFNEQFPALAGNKPPAWTGR